MIRLALALALLALTAEPASAGRAYGVLDPGRALLTFEVDGDALRAAALRMPLPCEEGGQIDFAAKFRIAPRGRQVLIPLRSERGTLRHRIHVVWGSGRDRLTFAGTFVVTHLADRKPHVRLVLRAEDCTGWLQRPARNEPGVLYTGATDDDEPVWLRRLPDGVEWVSGFGTACRPRGFVEGLHADMLPLAGPNGFGWTELVDGYSSGFYQDLYGLSVQLAGTFGPDAAAGELRIVARGGDWQADRCDTGKRTWRAVTG
jgi:hypothetical protein